MREFKTIARRGHIRARRRIIWLVSLLCVYSAAAAIGTPRVLPLWMSLVGFGIVGAVLVVELTLWTKAKRIRETFTVRLFDDRLQFSSSDATGEIAYEDISHMSQREDGNEIVEVRLRTVFGQTVKLRDLEDMREFNDHLRSRIDRKP